MNGGANTERLAQEFRILQRQWLLAREQWKDEVAHRFEQEHWNPHMPVVQAILQSMGRLESELADVLASIRRGGHV